MHREVGNKSFEGPTLGNLGNLHADQGRMEEARACWQEGARLLREVDDPAELALLLANRARIEAHAGNLDAARAALSEAKELATRLDADAAFWLGEALAEASEALDQGRHSPPTVR